MVSQIRRRFASSYKYLLQAKLRNFWRRSLWQYALGSALLTGVKPELVGNYLVTFFVIFLALCLLSLSLIVVSSRMQEKRVIFDADVEFKADHIQIEHRNKTLVETKDWRWILAVEETPAYFYLTIEKQPRLELIVDKAALTPVETDTLRNWLAQSR
jgi:hypothetical protein